MPASADQHRSEPVAADRKLQRSVNEAVPREERLPRRSDENPVSEQVREHGKGERKGPGPSTHQGGDEVAG